jgi:hypothetical protein
MVPRALAPRIRASDAVVRFLRNRESRSGVAIRTRSANRAPRVASGLPVPHRRTFATGIHALHSLEVCRASPSWLRLQTTPALWHRQPRSGCRRFHASDAVARFLRNRKPNAHKHHPVQTNITSGGFRICWDFSQMGQERSLLVSVASVPSVVKNPTLILLNHRATLAHRPTRLSQSSPIAWRIGGSAMRGADASF